MWFIITNFIKQSKIPVTGYSLTYGLIIMDFEVCGKMRFPIASIGNLYQEMMSF